MQTEAHRRLTRPDRSRQEYLCYRARVIRRGAHGKLTRSETGREPASRGISEPLLVDWASLINLLASRLLEGVLQLGQGISRVTESSGGMTLQIHVRHSHPPFPRSAVKVCVFVSGLEAKHLMCLVDLSHTGRYVLRLSNRGAIDRCTALFRGVMQLGPGQITGRGAIRVLYAMQWATGAE